MEAIALARPGRKRKRGPREPNGRISRAWAADLAQRDAMSVALDARRRHYGLSEDAARDQMAGTVIGRLAISGAISRDQYDAAMDWIRVCEAYSTALHSKGLFGAASPDGDGAGDYEEFCRIAINRWQGMTDALTDLCVELRSPAPKAALDVFIVKDIFMPELEGDLRLALNCLHRHFSGIGSRA